VVEASFLASFFGGVLSLLSPCSALLLPAFFAYAFGGGGELVKKTGVFYLGLCATLVPLGMGISAVSALFYGERRLLITLSGALLISFGILQLLGGGFTVGPMERLAGRIRGGRGVASDGGDVASDGGDVASDGGDVACNVSTTTARGPAVFALGAVYGFAGFCSGPILGAVLTVAAASGEALRGATLLAVYAAGMAAPLFLMALLWDRLDLGRRRWLRGGEVSVGPLRVHSTNLISGLMFVLLGVLFIAFEGTSALAGLYESSGAADLALAAEQRASDLTRGMTAAVFIGVVVLLIAALILRRFSRRGKTAGR
jgi:cytochrome c biogenesis protein CcdA